MPEDVVRIDIMSTLCFLDSMRGMKARLRELVELVDEAAGASSFAGLRLVARRKRLVTPKETEALLRVLEGGGEVGCKGQGAAGGEENGACFEVERPRKLTCFLPDEDEDTPDGDRPRLAAGESGVSREYLSKTS